MKTKLVKLKNMYTGDVVFTEKYDQVQQSSGTNFIEVYNPSNPYRTFLVNRDAYRIIPTK